MDTRDARKKLDDAFALIVTAAIDGKRCPKNWDFSDTQAPVALANEGRIKIEVSGRNFRQVTILVGPHAGKQTAPNPKGHRVWLVVAERTMRNGKEFTPQLRQEDRERRIAARQRRLNISVRMHSVAGT